MKDSSAYKRVKYISRRLTFPTSSVLCFAKCYHTMKEFFSETRSQFQNFETSSSLPAIECEQWNAKRETSSLQPVTLPKSTNSSPAIEWEHRKCLAIWSCKSIRSLGIGSSPSSPKPVMVKKSDFVTIDRVRTVKNSMGEVRHWNQSHLQKVEILYQWEYREWSFTWSLHSALQKEYCSVKIALPKELLPSTVFVFSAPPILDRTAGDAVVHARFSISSQLFLSFPTWW